MDEEEAAKNVRSVTSQARAPIALGNWKVVKRDFVERSQIYDPERLSDIIM
jgi:hypothetical protein